MIVTTYTCDLCEKSDTKGEDIWTVSVLYSPGYAHRGYSGQKKEAHWCHDCCVKRHLIGSKTEIAARTTPEPTLDDYVRAIVREEIETQ